MPEESQSNIAQSSPFNDKMMKKMRHEIKFMFILRSPTGSECVTNVAILTTTGSYLEYEMTFRKNAITPCSIIQLEGLFDDFILTSNSFVLISENYGESEPLQLYLDIVHHHLRFKMRHVQLDTIISRICGHHVSIFPGKKTSQITIRYHNTVWNYLIEKKRCPWITQQYEDQLKAVSKYRAREKRILRLGMYYCVVKTFRKKSK